MEDGSSDSALARCNFRGEAGLLPPDAGLWALVPDGDAAAAAAAAAAVLELDIIRIKYIDERLFRDSKPGEQVQLLQRAPAADLDGVRWPWAASLIVVAPAMPFCEMRENMDGLAMLDAWCCLIDIVILLYKSIVWCRLGGSIRTQTQDKG